MADQAKDGPSPTPGEEYAEDLAVQVRRLALQITRSAEQLVETIDIAGAADAQAIAHLADRLFGAIARRDLARHKAKAERPITFTGSNLKWCDATVPGVRFRGAPLNVTCNRVLRPDGTCPNAAQHVGGIAHRHSDANDLGDTQAAVVPGGRGTCGEKSSRWIPWGHACGARLNADGTCPDADHHV